MLTEAQRAAKARYREKNREQLRKKNREYREKNPGASAASARLYREKNPSKDREYYLENRERILEQTRQRHLVKSATPEGREAIAAYCRTYRKQAKAADPLNYIRNRVAQCRHRAKKLGVPFDLEWARVRDAWTGKCALTGIPFAIVNKEEREYRVSPFSPAIDRIDPSKGYTHGNVRWVLHAVNMFKLNYTDDVMLHIARALLKHSAEAGAIPHALHAGTE